MSYKNERADNIIDIYKPVAQTFIDIQGSHQVLTYIKSMEQLRGQDLDFVISTRFDIHFHRIVKDINLDYTKFNALFKEKGWWHWWSPKKFTTDNFFAFPYSMLEDFISVLYDLYRNPPRRKCTDLHQVFYKMQKKIGEDKTNIVSNVDELSHKKNLFYSLCNIKNGIVNE